MPPATVYLVQSVSGDHGEPVGSISVKADGTTFAEARVMLGRTGQFDFEYSFLDVNLARRMGENGRLSTLSKILAERLLSSPNLLLGM